MSQDGEVDSNATVVGGSLFPYSTVSILITVDRES